MTRSPFLSAKPLISSLVGIKNILKTGRHAPGLDICKRGSEVRTLKLDRLDFYNSFTLNSWHLCFKFLGWQSNSPQKHDSVVFSPFFFVFQKKCDNSKHTTLIFFTVKGRGHLRIETFFLACYFWHTKGQAKRGRDVGLFVLFFFLSSQCSTWRADQQAERAE